MLSFCFLLFMGGYVQQSADAIEVSATNIKNYNQSYLKNFVNYGVLGRDLDRTAGSDGEHEASVYIHNELYKAGLTAKTHTQNSSMSQYYAGVQEFTFVDDMGTRQTSYNIIWTLKGKNSDKKVVISTNYDNQYYVDLESETYAYAASEGINASAASVAVLLSLAKTLPKTVFDFDIEFVFFGAGYQNNAGAVHYNQSLNKAERETIMLMLDVSRIGVGQDLYFYNGEFSSLNDFFDENVAAIRYTTSIFGSATEDETTLGYSSAGYSSSTIVFEGSGLNVLHLFAGDYQVGWFGGFCEYATAVNITNTENDNIDYIQENYGQDLSNNMLHATQCIISLLGSDKLVETLSEQTTDWRYKFFKELDTTKIMLVIILILLIISIIIHYAISKKSYQFVFENKIDGVMIQIDEPDGESKPTVFGKKDKE